VVQEEFKAASKLLEIWEKKRERGVHMTTGTLSF
jgi:hypothetical protein